MSTRRSFALLAICFAALVAAVLFAPDNASAHPNHDSAHTLAAPESCVFTDQSSQPSDGSCGHGPDPFPDGGPVDPLPPNTFSASSAEDLAVCTGDGISGRRVQVMYLRQASTPDAYAAQLGNIRHYAHQVDALVQSEAAEQGNSRYVRFVHDSSCTISVLNVVMPDLANPLPASAGPVFQALRDLGYMDNNRKYLVFFDPPDGLAFCGEADAVYNDDRPGPENTANNVYGYAITGEGCWNSNKTAAHELFHALGAVQTSAPHSTGGGHSREFRDLMGSVDKPDQENILTCLGDGDFDELDCNKDDYFNTNPAPESYLATHWNTANSAYLGTKTSITLDKVSSKYNGWVTATLTNFRPSETISIQFNGQSIGETTADSSGIATFRFRTPLLPFGSWLVRASDPFGNTAETTLRIIPRIMLNLYSGEPGTQVRFYLYGHVPGEQVEIRFYDLAGNTYKVLGVIPIAENGRGSKLFRIPSTAQIGKHKIVAKVLGVSRSSSDSFTVTAPGASEDPTSTPTPTVSITTTAIATGTPTPDPTATDIPSPTPTATSEPTDTPSPEPETSTPEPTATVVPPTETPPAELPTETPISVESPDQAVIRIRNSLNLSAWSRAKRKPAENSGGASVRSHII